MPSSVDASIVSSRNRADQLLVTSHLNDIVGQNIRVLGGGPTCSYQNFVNPILRRVVANFVSATNCVASH